MATPASAGTGAVAPNQAVRQARRAFDDARANVEKAKAHRREALYGALGGVRERKVLQDRSTELLSAQRVLRQAALRLRQAMADQARQQARERQREAEREQERDDSPDARDQVAERGRGGEPDDGHAHGQGVRGGQRPAESRQPAVGGVPAQPQTRQPSRPARAPSGAALDRGGFGRDGRAL